LGLGFVSKKPNRTETKKTRKKPSQTEKNRAKTEPNRFEPVFALKKPNQTETGRFDPCFGFFFFNFDSVTFFDKNRTESKMITPSY
jgi:hypothetical protein